eukprot:CAMPEP_0184557124 /NCGR_PEP_ID=MMETSP0199_2-20130426/41940_1 /TAXON_ID=1112570 /ORGANISM="Thraustochytrium sp., Strain LLF1b" /LENGTH=396 /DNA_ID=CAMNT_0026953965 /DNA_START=209 /DNA_END=1399 /DNA_ORIENTATION=-
MLKFEGSSQFRTRLVGSVLSNRPVLIRKIRELSETPGVTNYEVSFAQLLDKLTNGTTIVINSTGTSVTVSKPGYIIGGTVEHECEGRAVGYFLEGVLPLCLFAKRPVRLTLTGITNDEVDISADLLKTVTMRVLTRFGITENYPSVEIVQRGLAPHGKGKIIFTCPVIKELKATQLLDAGFVRKVRGVAYGVRVSPQLANRMATTARGVFNTLLPDVYINTDHVKNMELVTASDPGYGISLYAESTTGCYLGAKRSAIRQSALARQDDDDEVSALEKGRGRRREVLMLEEAHPGVKALSDPEGVAENASYQLLEEIERAGCIDTAHQPLALLLMALCPEDVSKIRFGRLSARAVHTLRLIRDIFGVMYKIKPDETDDSVVCSCVGGGYKNLSRKVT